MMVGENFGEVEGNLVCCVNEFCFVVDRVVIEMNMMMVFINEQVGNLCDVILIILVDVQNFVGCFGDQVEELIKVVWYLEDINCLVEGCVLECKMVIEDVVDMFLVKMEFVDMFMWVFIQILLEIFEIVDDKVCDVVNMLSVVVEVVIKKVIEQFEFMWFMVGMEGQKVCDVICLVQDDIIFEMFWIVIDVLDCFNEVVICMCDVVCDVYCEFEVICGELKQGVLNLLDEVEEFFVVLCKVVNE